MRSSCDSLCTFYPSTYSLPSKYGTGAGRESGSASEPRSVSHDQPRYLVVPQRSGRPPPCLVAAGQKAAKTSCNTGARSLSEAMRKHTRWYMSGRNINARNQRPILPIGIVTPYGRRPGAGSECLLRVLSPPSSSVASTNCQRGKKFWDKSSKPQDHCRIRLISRVS